eukprot:COSAG04_NODE_15688_length_523_cov_1.365566_2_plen_24_part_01
MAVLELGGAGADEGAVELFRAAAA